MKKKKSFDQINRPVRVELTYIFSYIMQWSDTFNMPRFSRIIMLSSKSWYKIIFRPIRMLTVQQPLIIYFASFFVLFEPIWSFIFGKILPDILFIVYIITKCIVSDSRITVVERQPLTHQRTHYSKRYLGGVQYRKTWK